MHNTLLLAPLHPPVFLDFPTALHTWKEQRNYLVLCFNIGSHHLFYQLPIINLCCGQIKCNFHDMNIDGVFALDVNSIKWITFGCFMFQFFSSI